MNLDRERKIGWKCTFTSIEIRQDTPLLFLVLHGIRDDFLSCTATMPIAAEDLKDYKTIAARLSNLSTTLDSFLWPECLCGEKDKQCPMHPKGEWD